jgi:hypothetical protein
MIDTPDCIVVAATNSKDIIEITPSCQRLLYRICCTTERDGEMHDQCSWCSTSGLARTRGPMWTLENRPDAVPRKITTAVTR